MCETLDDFTDEFLALMCPTLLSYSVLLILMRDATNDLVVQSAPQGSLSRYGFKHMTMGYSCAPKMSPPMKSFQDGFKY